jgi:hypothetical protein
MREFLQNQGFFYNEKDHFCSLINLLLPSFFSDKAHMPGMNSAQEESTIILYIGSPTVFCQ